MQSGILALMGIRQNDDLDIIVQRKKYQSDDSEPDDNSDDVPSAPSDAGGSQAINKLPK